MYFFKMWIQNVFTRRCSLERDILCLRKVYLSQDALKYKIKMSLIKFITLLIIFLFYSLKRSILLW